MTQAIDTMNEQFKQLGEIGQRSVEPMRIFGTVAVDAFEQLTRKNYALAGDLIDYSFRQSSLPFKGGDLNETASAQIAEGKAFVELMNQRAAEYVDLATTLGGKLREAGSEAASAVRSA